MNERFQKYSNELNNIGRVLDKLVTKQNSSVFDKLCIKCNDLFMSIAAEDTKNMKDSDIRTIIALLKQLLDYCIKLSMYKQYLISVIEENVQILQQRENSQVKKLELDTRAVQDAA